MREIISVIQSVGQRELSIGLLALGLALSSCATSTREILDERQSRGRPRSAAYAADGFTMDHRSPEPRPYPAWDLYYKHCTLVSRNPYPSRTEYACTEP
jgi:hypothetical protein